MVKMERRTSKLPIGLIFNIFSQYFILWKIVKNESTIIFVYQN